MVYSPSSCASGKYPTKFRLQKRAEYLQVQGGGKRNHGYLFVVIVSENVHGYPRLGITVTKKVHKRAVRRNRIKRLVREWFRTTLAGELNGLDIIVVARPSAVGASFGAVCRDLEKSLQRLKVFSKPIQNKEC